jgi:hypothetical protein
MVVFSRKIEFVYKMGSWFLLAVVSIVSSYSTAVAAVDQFQDHLIAAGDIVLKTGSIGSAAGRNLTTVGHGQRAFGACADIALQSQTGALTQDATAVGTCGPLSVSQEAVAEGSQSQGPGVVIKVYPTPPVPQVQEQDLSVGLAETEQTSPPQAGAQPMSDSLVSAFGD